MYLIIPYFYDEDKNISPILNADETWYMIGTCCLLI